MLFPFYTQKKISTSTNDCSLRYTVVEGKEGREVGPNIDGVLLHKGKGEKGARQIKVNVVRMMCSCAAKTRQQYKNISNSSK